MNEQTRVLVDLEKLTRYPIFAEFSDNGVFHCPVCGANHNRGPVNGSDAYRCLGCGNTAVLDPDVVLTMEEARGI